MSVDIWESTADLQRFNQEQLMPSMKKVSQERGIQLPDPFPEPKITEAYDLVRGASATRLQSWENPETHDHFEVCLGGS